ncbi:MAG: response regulator [bacterium]|nr:response regulator [bacterium]
MKKIVVIDDDLGILEAVKTVLELEGYEVTALTKFEGVENICDCKPNLILLDVLLPGISGAVIARQLKKNKASKKIPIIMFSASSNLEKTTEDLGVQGFIAKPFDISELLKTVEMHIA